MAALFFFNVFCLHFVLCLCVITSAELVNITVPGIGEIVGETETETLPDGVQATIAFFRGIPYAEPPVGELRFAKPVPKVNLTALTTPFRALEFGPACPQHDNVTMSEDCLYLNVYASYENLLGVPNVSKLVPVFVWIHGGAFVSGQGTQNPRRLATVGKIVIVTINYRLGALGFLTTDDEHAPGNFGLWDQRLAFQWVKDNIAAFGGDPDQITIGGGSAGAYCVTYQALYPHNKGLFQRFISASGTAISASTTRTKAGIYAKLLADKLGCDTSSSLQIVSCLREKSYKDIVGANLDIQAPFEVAWSPAIDGEFVRENPRDQIIWPPSDANLTFLTSLDAMFGTTSEEGSVSFGIWVEDIARDLHQSVEKGVSEQVFDKVVHDILVSEKQSPDRIIVDAIKYEYRDWQDPSSPSTLGQSTVDLLTDRQWFIPNVVFSRNHAANNTRTNTYLFQFDMPHQVNFTYGYPWLRGAVHVQYGRYVWGLTEITLNLSKESDRKDWELAKALMTYWSNFIKTGDPNHPVQVDEHWLPFTVQDEHYLYLDTDVISARKRCKARRVAFWLDYLPKFTAASSGNVEKDTRECQPSSGQRLHANVFGLLCTLVLLK